MKNQQRRRQALVGLVFLLAISILFECWQATAAAAKAGGRPMPDLWPVTLEGFLIVLILVYWDARSDHRKAPLARLLLAGITLVAAGVQALAAPPTWLGWVTAAVTPIILTAVVEFVVWLLYGGAVAAEESASRKVQTPRPSEQAAGDVADFGGQPVVPTGTPGLKAPGLPARGEATPPPLTPQTATTGSSGPQAGEDGSLSDRPRPVTPVATTPTDRGRTVTPPLEARHDEALRRRKENPEAFEAYVAKHGLDRDAMLAMAARRGWPAASGNGHKQQVPA